jgi:peptide/nickel transport system ATP-binding protein
MAQDAILEIEDLTVGYQQGGVFRDAARHVSLALPPGQTCGLVGESGSGKTTLALAVMQYLPQEGRVRQGHIRFDGRDMTALSRDEMRAIWGAQMALVPQEPQSSLNPSIPLGEQVAEILRRHNGLDGKKAKTRVLELFETVRLGDPERVARSYPHQISGGMLQRVSVAMALSTEPRLLLLDEPTSSLDVTTQAAMLDLFRELIKARDTSMLYITHNLGVVAQISDRVAVMYAGELVENAPTVDLYRQPLHPYTRGLLDCIPKLGENKRNVQLRPIRDRIPPLDDLPEGCVFRPRCPLAIDVCYEYPPLYAAGEGHHTRCHRWEEIAAGEIDARQPAPESAHTASPSGKAPPVLSMEDVHVHFTEERSLIDLLRGKKKTEVKAVAGVTLNIPRGRTVGLVGESGSGKTTLARAIVGLAERTAGEIVLRNLALPPGLRKRTSDMLCCLQIIFQDPEEALNPYLSVGETLRRPVMRLRGESREEAERIVANLLESVHLSADYAARLPGQLSGGEKQRVALARAFAPNPDLIIADEPVSSLDVSVQASILNLFDELRAQREIGTLFISHDLAVVGYLADVVAVIYLGQLMEVTPADAIFDPPHHPYTEALLSSVPLIDPEGEQMQLRLEGDVPSPSEDVSGCPFHTRCPRFLGDICVEEVPPWREDQATGKRYFCHISREDLLAEQKRAFRFSESRNHTRI